MSEDRKIIKHEGVKYYKKESRLVPIGEDKVPADIKTKKSKLNLQPEILIDIFKLLNFVQLLAVQQTNFYFKNFIDKYGKELARKKFKYLYFVLDFDFRFDGHSIFVRLEHQPNDFQLSEQLEEKWKRAIEESIPMFLTWPEMEELETVVCDLGQDYFNEFHEMGQTIKPNAYCLKLPWIPKSIKDMKIARSLFQLLFNCAFTIFEIGSTIINPQMIQLLFDEDKTNMPLQIHSQQIELLLCGNHVFDFVLNHLVSNELEFYIDSTEFDIEKNLDVLFKVLANGGSKFSMINFPCIDSKFYNFIIEQIVETSQDLSKMVKEIGFHCMRGPRITKRAEEAEDTLILTDGFDKTTIFQLSNKHNPKIKFFVCIKENTMFQDYGYPDTASVEIKRKN